MRKDIKSRATRRLKIIEGQIRGLQKMVNKIAKFQEWIINHPDYVTMEQDIADGVLIIWRKYPDTISYDMITKGE